MQAIVRIPGIVLLGLLAAGCAAQIERLFPDATEDAPPPGMVLYLQTLKELAALSADEQRLMVEQLELGQSRAPTTTNTLRLALVMASPTHEQADLALGGEMLQHLLDTDDTLLPAERLIAEVHLAHARAWLAERAAGEFTRQEELEAARAAGLEEARDAALATVSTEQAELRRRLRAEGEEIARLQQALREAEEKLEALMSIERTIRERE